MPHFICQLDWAMGCPAIWPNLILGVSVSVFLDETFESLDLVKQIAFLLMWVNFIQSTKDMNRRKRLSKKDLLLPDCLS